MECITNLTTQKELQEQLIHSEKLSAVGQLSAGVAHEFNNILAVIRGNAELLLSTAKLNDNIKENLQTIDAQTKHGAEIVRNMMAFSKPKKSKQEYFFIQDIIEEVYVLQKTQLEFEQILFKKIYAKTEMIKADKSQMHQVFLNLFINAIHAIKPKGKGEIHISTKMIGHKVEIKFLDNGIGMDEQTKIKIFEPFFTTKGALAKDNLGIKGSGLGLSITYAIIKNLNGIISVKSELNKGTTFFITLPTVKSQLFI